MFKVPEGYALAKQVDAVEKNYTIQKNDYLTIEVYTNSGERIIDPDLKLSQSNVNSGEAKKEVTTYLINDVGTTRFPMVGEVKLEGLTVLEAEDILKQAYTKFYEQPFVRLKCTNKRVVVLGSPGGVGGGVVPLVNENMRLTEVLALSKGLNSDSKSRNIRVLRGDQAYVVDFSTLEGFVKNNMIMEPGDVVYVEPVRRPFSEGLRDNAALLSIFTSVSTLIIVLISL
ncbi:MAG: polysaccharide biosynthesis/export family protein [Chryseolinea sp.]